MVDIRVKSRYYTGLKLLVKVSKKSIEYNWFKGYRSEYGHSDGFRKGYWSWITIFFREYFLTKLFSE